MPRLPRLLRRKPPPPAALPPGLRVYAVGDIHGRDDLLEDLEHRIAVDHARRTAAGDVLVIFMGDYIDRGPSSRAVVERLASRRFAGLPIRMLLGNHEDALLRFLADPVAGSAWLDWGGRETLASYGFDASLASRPSTLRLLAAGLAERMPPSHHAFLRDLELSIELGDFLFVHAGVRPGIDLAKQERRDLLGIRTEFLDTRKRLTHRIVHGHTVTEEVDIQPHRIGVDTGAYRTGRLSAVVIERAAVEVLDA